MSEKCEELKRCCKEVKEEVFKHLAAVESSGGVVAQLSTATLFTAINFVLTSISAVFSAITVSVSVYTFLRQDLRQDPPATWLIILIPASYLAVAVIVSRLCRKIRSLEETSQRAMEFVGKATEYHRKRLGELVRKLDNCCEKLRGSGCEYCLETLCSDLDDLRKLASVKSGETDSAAQEGGGPTSATI